MDTLRSAHFEDVADESRAPDVIAVLKRRYPLRIRLHIKPGSTRFHPHPVAEKPGSPQPGR